MVGHTKILTTFVLFLHVVNTELGSVTSILISPDIIKYNLQCGNAINARGSLWVAPTVLFWQWSVGIVQLMCHNPPNQCKFMCEYLKLQDSSRKGKNWFQFKYDFYQL